VQVLPQARDRRKLAKSRIKAKGGKPVGCRPEIFAG
jgi:hypothetical protein